MAIDKTLVIKILGDASSLKQTYSEISKESQKFNKEIEKHGISLQAVGKVMTAVGGTIVGAMAATVVAVANSAGEIEHLSRVSGVSAETFQKLSYAAKQDDVDMQSLSAGLVKLSKNMSSASSGSGDAAEAFDKLHIRVTNADGSLRDSSDVLLDVADKFKNMTNPAEKTALAITLFGKAGANLVPLLEQGRDGMEAYGEEAEKLGLVISNNNIKALDDFGDSLDNVKAGFGGFGNQIAVSLVPVMQTFADGLKSLLKDFNGIPAPVKTGITLFTALSAAILLVSGAVVTFGASITAAAVAAAPYIAAVAGLVAAITAVSVAVDKHNNGIKNQIEATQKQRENLESLTSEYQELKNKTSLTTDEKKRLLEVQNKISEIAPDVVAGYDKEGNAIIDLNAALKAQIELKRQELQLTQQQINKEIADIEKKIAANNKELAIAQAMEKYYESQANNYMVVGGKVGAADEYKKKTLAEYNAELRKHNAINEEAQAKLKNLKQQYDDITNLLNGKVVTTVKKTTTTTSTLTDEQIAKQKEAAEKSKKLAEDWSEKVYEITHTALENLNHEEEKALQQANLTEKAKADIKAYYAQKRIDLERDVLQKKLDAERERTIQELQLQADLEEAQGQNLQAALDRDRAQEMQELANTELTEQQKDQIKKVHELNRQNIAKQFRDQEKLDEDRKMQYLYDNHQISLQEYRDYLTKRLADYQQYSDEWIRLTKQIEDLNHQLDVQLTGVDWIQLGDDMKSALHDGLVSGLTDAIMQGKQLGQVFDQLARQILQLLAQRAIVEPLVTGIMSGFGWGSYHTGGEVQPIPRAHSGMFISDTIIRAHNGLNLAPDEVPIIAQTGERILSREQNKRYEEGLTQSIEVQVNVINQTGQQVSARQQSAGFDGERYVVNVILDNVARNGELRKLFSR